MQRSRKQVTEVHLYDDKWDNIFISADLQNKMSRMQDTEFNIKLFQIVYPRPVFC